MGAALVKERTIEALAQVRDLGLTEYYLLTHPSAPATCPVREREGEVYQISDALKFFEAGKKPDIVIPPCSEECICMTMIVI